MATVRRSSRWRLALRSTQMVRAGLAGTGTFLREARRRRGTEDALMGALGRACVEAATRLGATFIKVGQIASTRADLLPSGLVRELSTLRDQVPPFAFAQVRATIEAEFGGPLESFYDHFEPEPVAAASVAQVHRAHWRATGDVVAVKVRRPDILEKVRLDRSILLFVGRTLERLVPSIRLMSLAEALRAFCDAVEEQSHLVNEATHNVRFTANFASDPDVHFPTLYAQGCSDAVLTMEFIDGVDENQLEGSGVDVPSIVTTGMRCVCRMIFLHGFVHADLHPGNMRFLSPGRLVLLDLGLVGRLDDTDRRVFAELIFALASGDGRTVARLFHEHAPHHAITD